MANHCKTGRSGIAIAVLCALSACGQSMVPSASTAEKLAQTQDAVDYEIPPTRISPDQGQLIKDNPYFREPQLLWTDHGLITAFMEIPADDSSNRAGWSCTSDNGKKWSCSA